MSPVSTSSEEAPRLSVGFIGLGDQGLPMADAIAEAGFPLHVWARRPASLDNLDPATHTRHASVTDLAVASDVVALCVSTDEATLQLAGELLPAMRPGTFLVNHGTGTPANAVRLFELAAGNGVAALDIPVSGGRPAAEARTLTALVGGPKPAAQHLAPVLRAFAAHVLYIGPAGAGQLAKLFNNALLMMNQAAIADILDLANQAGLDAVPLTEALKVGSGTSAALTLFNTMITLATVDHLTDVGVLDMEIFDQAMREAGADPNASTTATARAVSGARRMREVVTRLNPND